MAIQGEWGKRIARQLASSAPTCWALRWWSAPPVLPPILDEPEEFLPRELPEADLLLVLTESPGLTDLAPDLASMCGAQAAIVAVDRRSCAQPGLRRQVQLRLEALGVACAFAMPFCSLAPSPTQDPTIRAFAERYGRPELSCRVRDGRIVGCTVVRQAPCGNTQYVAEQLVGVAVADAEERAGLLHHYYPCWGGMEADPVTGEHALLHIAATLAQRAVARTLRTYRSVERGD